LYRLFAVSQRLSLLTFRFHFHYAGGNINSGNINKGDDIMAPVYYETILNPLAKQGIRYGMKVVNEVVRTPGEMVDIVHGLVPDVPREVIAKVDVGYLKAITLCASKGEGFETSFAKGGFGLHGDKDSPDGRYDDRTDSTEIHFSPVKETREAAKNAAKEKVPVRYSGPIISGVFDETRKEENGRITRDAYIMVNGRGIEVVGPQASIEFVPADGTAVKADLSKVLENKPSKLYVLVPANMPLGVCYLRITTHYSGHGERLLKTPQTVTFKLPLTVVNAAS
jgi:hypothetical protein